MSIVAVYADPAQSTHNAALLATRAKVTLAEAQAFLRDQSSAQQRKRAYKPTAASFAPIGDQYATWAADVMFMTDYAGVNKKRTCILTLADLSMLAVLQPRPPLTPQRL